MVSGKVERMLPSRMVEVRTESGLVRASVSATSGGVTVCLRPGQMVEIELSPYDPNRGKLLRVL